MGKSTVKETKKEHYVPQCYLERWKNSKGYVAVYDKKLKMSRGNNIKDIACERYYYDIDYRELSAQKLALLRELGIEPTKDEQFVEHFLSGHVEGVYSQLLKKVLDREISPWYEKNCFFLSQEDKIDFAICIAFQYIRTKETRRMLSDMSNCLEQAFKAMNVPDEMAEKYRLHSGEEKNIQGNMLLDIEHILDLARSFFSLTWVLGINKTTKSFYTSDNPIGTKAHVKNPYISMSGIRSEGVEVYFPLSPKHILIMCDGTYHKELASYDRKYVQVEEEQMVEHYNWYCVNNSNRCIYSENDNFAVVDRILEDNPNAFEIPKTQLSWGGKTFIPE